MSEIGALPEKMVKRQVKEIEKGSFTPYSFPKSLQRENRSLCQLVVWKIISEMFKICKHQRIVMADAF